MDDPSSKNDTSVDQIVEKKRSTLERLHLGFIAKLIGRGQYASDEEHEFKTDNDLLI